MRLAPLRFLLAFIVALILVSPGFAANEVKNLYEAEVDVANKDAQTRSEAFGLALLQVAVKVSGRRGAGANPVVVEAVQHPDRFVQQFRYREIEPPSAEDTAPGGQRLKLWVQLDPKAVDALMRDAGMPVWGRVRPSVLMLVVIDPLMICIWVEVPRL